MSDQPSPQSLRTEAIETLLIEKKLLTSTAVDTVLTTFSEQVGPMNGAKLVARAWVDEGFKASGSVNAQDIPWEDLKVFMN